MNDIERRLTDAMGARAGEVEPKDEHEALDRITKRVDMNRNRNRNLAIVGLAAAVLAVVGAVALLRDDNGSKQQVNVGVTSSTTSTSPSTTTSTTVAVPFPADAIWPFAAGSQFTSPADAARSFAVDYLGMTHARVGATTSDGVEIFPNDRGSIRMLVQVAERSPFGFVVLGAKSDDIVVDSPQPHDRLTSTLTLDGTSVAFEAQIGVALREVGSSKTIATGSVMGGSTEMQPFHGSIDAPVIDRPLVLILFEGDASGEQTFTTATVIFLDAAE